MLELQCVKFLSEWNEAHLGGRTLKRRRKNWRPRHWYLSVPNHIKRGLSFGIHTIRHHFLGYDTLALRYRLLIKWHLNRDTHPRQWFQMASALNVMAGQSRGVDPAPPSPPGKTWLPHHVRPFKHKHTSLPLFPSWIIWIMYGTQGNRTSGQDHLKPYIAVGSFSDSKTITMLTKLRYEKLYIRIRFHSLYYVLV